MKHLLVFFSCVTFVTSCDHIKKRKNEAGIARAKADSIMRAFKNIEEDLDSTRKVLDSLAVTKPGI